jgi:hypothetical protein
MADKKEEHTVHSVASKIAKALLKVKPEKRVRSGKKKTGDIATNNQHRNK